MGVEDIDDADMPPVGDMSCFPDETSDVMSFFSGATMPPVGDILR